jgi:hypothetical protein
MQEKKGIKKQVIGKIKETFELEKTDRGITVTAHKMFLDESQTISIDKDKEKQIKEAKEAYKKKIWQVLENIEKNI